MFKSIYYFLLLKFNPFFDKEYYEQTYQEIKELKINPIIHFLKLGWKEGRNPSAIFDTNYYLENNPDVKKKKINPLIHYIKHGHREGRKPSPNYKEDQGKKSINTIILNKQKFIGNKLEKVGFNRSDIIKSNKSDNQIIFLHVGQGKTGTSVIQNFLDVNRENLIEKNSLLYPNFLNTDFSKGRSHNHEKWYKSLNNQNEKLIEELERLQIYIKQHSIKKIILSFEGWDLDPIFQKNIYKALIRNKYKQIKIIYYIRRIDHFVQSSWKQWGIHNFDNLENYYCNPQFTKKYKRIYEYLSEWGDLIGVENIIVRPYEKQQLNEGLLQNFLSLFDVEYETSKWNQIEDHYWVKNPGFNRDVLEVFKICRHLYNDDEKYRLFDLFYKSLGKEFQKEPFEKYSFLSPEQKLILLYENKDFEPMIARKFLNRERLFYEDWPSLDEPWEPYEGLTLEKVLPILIKLIENQKT